MESSEELKLPPVPQKLLQPKEMASKTALRSLVCELRPRLCSGNVFIQTSDKLSKVKMSSNSSSVILSVAGTGWSGVMSIDFTHELLFSPSGFKIDDNSITFSVVFEPADKRVGSSAAEVLKVVGSKNGVIEPGIIYEVSGQQCRAKCRECGSCVWNDQWFKFKRILELPSTPLEEMVGEWFCHGHGDSHSLTPQTTDCYHDHLSTVIYLEDSTTGVLSCSKCDAWLGTIDKWKMCRVWGCTVKWENRDGSPWLNLPVSPFEAFLEALRRASLDDGVLKPVVKVLIESRMTTEGRSWILLCIFNGDLKVLFPGDADKPECDVENSCRKLESGWSVLLSELGPEKDVNEELLEWDSHPDDLPFKIELHPKIMKRVLYRCENELSGLNDWIKRSDVVILKVAEPMFKEGLDHLKKSNMFLPQNQRQSEGFNISYLAV